VIGLFTGAFELKAKRYSGAILEDSDSDQECLQCAAESDKDKHMKKRLSDVMTGMENLVYLSVAEVVNKSSMSSMNKVYYIVDTEDINIWQRYVNSNKHRDKLLDFLLYSYKPASLPPQLGNLDEPDRNRALRILSVFQPLICTEHGEALHAALFETEDTTRFHSRISLMDDASYAEFVTHATAAVLMTFNDHETPLVEQLARTVETEVVEASEFLARWKSLCLHPSFRLLGPDEKRSLTSYCVKGADETRSMEFVLNLPVCRHERCNEKYIKLNEEQKRKSSSVAIVIDEDITPTHFQLRVFEAAIGSDNESILTSLRECEALPSDEDNASYCFLRRSRRKRKTIFPFGSLIDLDNVRVQSVEKNVASLRLVLLEQCANGTAFELNHTLKLIAITTRPTLSSAAADPFVVDVDAEHISPLSETATPHIFDLTYDCNKQTLSEIYEAATGERLCDSLQPAESLILVRFPTSDPSAKDIDRDVITDHLIDLSNTTLHLSSQKDKKGSKTSGFRTERGFTGTLLSSSATVPKKDEDISKLAMSPVSDTDISDRFDPTASISHTLPTGTLKRMKQDTSAESECSSNGISSQPDADFDDTKFATNETSALEEVSDKPESKGESGVSADEVKSKDLEPDSEPVANIPEVKRKRPRGIFGSNNIGKLQQQSVLERLEHVGKSSSIQRNVTVLDSDSDDDSLILRGHFI
jgi:hypothetical protein